MKNKLLWIVLVAFFSSCSSIRNLTSTVQPSEIRDLQLLEPCAYISLIEKGNRTKFNDTLSKESKELILKIYSDLSDRVPVKGLCIPNDTLIKKKLEREIEFMCLSAMKQHRKLDIQITSTVDSLLHSNGKRFGLITISSGFTRKKGNYGKQIIKGMAIGLLTLGNYVDQPIKSSSSVYSLIVDAQENNVAFFNKSIINGEPLDEKILKKQFLDIFNGYFFAKEKGKMK